MSTDEKNDKTALSGNRKQESPEIIVESLLSLDNTLLCNVDTDSELHNSFETSNFSKNHSKSTKQLLKEQTQNVDLDMAVLNTSQSTSPNLNEWVNKSLMDQIFAQFDSQDTKGISEHIYLLIII